MWTKTFGYKGHHFDILGGGNGECHVMLTQEQVVDFGEDIYEFMDWVSNDLDEFGDALTWRSGDFDYEEEEYRDFMMSLLDNQFVTEQEKEHLRERLFAPKKRQYELPSPPPPSNPRPTRSGYVYLIRGENGYYKIGRSMNAKKRIGLFGVKLPFDVEPIHLIDTQDMIGLEKELHTRFNDRRIRGEWFELSQDDVEYIRSL